jgi:leucyl aminopeptidase
MALAVEVTSPDDLPGDLVAVGLPVPVGADGPALPEGLGRSMGRVELPGDLPAEMLRRQGFTAKVGQSLVLRPTTGGPAMVLLGLGDPAGLDPERWRRAAAALVRGAGDGGTATLVVPEPVLGGEPGEVGAAIAEGAVLAAYRFDDYRSTPRPPSLDRLLVVSGGHGHGDVTTTLGDGVRRGVRTAEAVAFARDLINTPPSDLPPSRLAERVAERLGGEDRTSVEVWDEERIAAERLGGLLGVSRGSLEPPRLVRATFDPADPVTVEGRVPHVVLVGKGITFDSGGLSLKTAEGMTTMKTDMSGAAIVLAVLSACADLGVRVRVTALAPIAENMPGARAVKPGDVLTIRNGSTIEVLNTDAEGRLVLADALSLAAEIEPAPDAVVDVATLTGAAMVALGTGIAALFGSDEALVERVRRAGARVGERLWPMPLPEDYAEHIDSEVADMKNIGRAGQAGAIAAALLLVRFTGGLPWAHLDIAGPGRSAESSGYLSKGGTAFGVRTLLALLEDYGSKAGREELHSADS